MGLVKLQSSTFPNDKEYFTFEKKKKKKKKNKKKQEEEEVVDGGSTETNADTQPETSADTQPETDEKNKDNNNDVDKKALEAAAWWSNNVNVPLACLTITIVQMLLTSVDFTQAEELFAMISGDHESFLQDRLDVAKKAEEEAAAEATEAAEVIRREIPGGINHFTQKAKEWEMTEREKRQADLDFAKGMQNAEDWVEYLKNINVVLNPIAQGARTIVDINKDDPLQCKRIIRRLIEKDGIVNNLLLPFINWYKKHLFPAVLYSCSIGMFIPIFVSFLMSGIGPIFGIIKSSEYFRNHPSRMIFVGGVFLILFSLLTCVWMIVWPLSLIFIGGSFLNIFYWLPYILIFHFKDLFCEEERAGYIRDPILLPYSEKVCYGFNSSLEALIWWLDFFNLRSMVRDLEEIECSNEREILRKACRVLGGIYDMIWEYVIVAFLIKIQILLLAPIILFFRILALFNPQAFFNRLADPDRGFKLYWPGAEIVGDLKWPEQELDIVWKLPKQKLDPYLEPIAQYLTPGEWADWFDDGWFCYINEIDESIPSKIGVVLNPVRNGLENVFGISIPIGVNCNSNE